MLKSVEHKAQREALGIKNLSLSFQTVISFLKNGGVKRDRTADLLRARQALSQLSYSPIKGGLVYGQYQFSSATVTTVTRKFGGSE